ncbi:N-acetylmuramoyl-L-alanine amidase [Helicobacter sp. MIT 14-3879]|nr:N-acetylmuramoyl-L-alanine amidase [Helicobacter sp. MIT 14-3879]
MFFLLVPLLLFSTNLKIISLKQDTNTIRVEFNNKISKNDFSKYNIANGIYYDIKAELTLPKKSFNINENVVIVAQNNKTTSRIVIHSKHLNNFDFSIKNKTLILMFKENLEITNLFKSLSLDANKTTTSKKDNTKESKEVNDKKKIMQEQDSVVAKDNQNKVIVIDPGHGGKDCGAKTGKICEKIITLNIAKKVKEVLKNRGYKVYITRESDKYISLTNRTKMANEKNANIFVSIHANSLEKSSKNYKIASGIETYFLSTARSERAKKVAEAENKDDIEVMNYFSKLSFLNSINSQRLIASNKLAIDVQSGMLINARKLHKKTIDGGVREGPFWVLAGALMPSILIEVGYMTNENDLARLQNKEYQYLLAIGIADGIDGYFLKNF